MKGSNSRKERKKYRAPEDRERLTFRLEIWRDIRAESISPIRPPDFILSDTSMKQVVELKPGELKSEDDITNLLQETPEWSKEFAGSLFRMIHSFDNPGEYGDTDKGEGDEEVETLAEAIPRSIPRKRTRPRSLEGDAVLRPKPKKVILRLRTPFSEKTNLYN